jgi:hypothetical protein
MLIVCSTSANAVVCGKVAHYAKEARKKGHGKLLVWSRCSAMRPTFCWKEKAAFSQLPPELDVK